MLEAEKGVIGSVLVSEDALFHVYNRLKAEMFENEFLGECYQTILGLYDIGEDVTIVAIAQRLENDKYTRELIVSNLRECVESVPNSAEIKSYANTIINEFKARMVKDMFARVSLQPKHINDTIAECIEQLEALKENTEVKSKSMKQIVADNRDRYFNDDVGEDLIKTGFYRLDDCLGGLEGGDVTVIGARPAVGKSALVTQIIANVADRGKKVGYFNLEMNESQVYERFLARHSGLSLMRIRRAKSFLGGEQPKFDKANEKIERYNVVVSTGGKTVSEIRNESRHQQFDLIVIDYLQLIKSDTRYTNRASEVGNISKAIKALAMELKVPIILLSQLNRLAAHAEDGEPDMSELRESGDIEQDASNIILLWNMSKENPQFKGLKIEKQRQGELLKEGLKFDGQFMTFDESMDEFWKFKKGLQELEKSGRRLDTSPYSDFDF